MRGTAWSSGGGMPVASQAAACGGASLEKHDIVIPASVLARVWSRR
jgi:hypothetical protein